jgi:hypothetical protein
MTRKLIDKTPSFRGIAPFIAVVTVMIALVAPAQTGGAGEPSGKRHVLFTPRGADKVEGVSTNQSRATRGVPWIADSPPPLDFLPPVIYSSGGLVTTSVAVADLNGDRKPDLVVANCSPTGSPNCAGEGSVAVFLGNGDGTFQPAATYDSGGGNTQSVAVADVNGDGKPDLLVANEGSSTVGVLLGNGDGTFQSAIIYGSGGLYPQSIAVADVNGDGKPDLVVSNNCDIGCSPENGGVVGVLLGNGDGTFQPAVPYNSGGGFLDSVAVADVNGDGIPDLVVANEANGTVGVLLGNGDGTFQQVVTYSSGGADPTSVVVADVNGDRKPDLLVANCSASGGSGCIDESVDGSVGVLLGNGDGTFQAAVAYDSGGSGALSVAVADVNGDGKPDLLVANFCGTGCSSPGAVGVLLGKGHGIFAHPVSLSPDATNSVAVADVNGDGKPDLLVATNDATGMGAVGVLLNNTDIAPRFTKTVVSTSGSPSLVGQPVTFTARVTSALGAIPDSELVTFYDGMTALASVTLSSGTARYTTSSLSAKTHYIKATYNGDPTFKPSTGSVTQVVEKYSTTTTLTSSPNPSHFGQVVTFTAHVTSSGPSTPTGKVAFLDGTLWIGSATLSSGGVAKLTKSNLAVGTHPITAQYKGDAVSDTSTSSVVNQDITLRPTKTVVSTSGSPSLVGQPVTFTALVTSTLGAIPNGELVTFYDGTTAIGTNLTKGGVAAFTTSSLTVRAHAIKATYAGDVHFKTSSGSVIQVVEKYPTTTTLTSSLNPSQFGQAVTFTALVTGTGPAPTGKVTFLDRTTVIGYVTLSGGVAQVTKSKLAVGTHSIKAHYDGDASSTTSTSAVVSQVVQ